MFGSGLELVSSVCRNDVFGPGPTADNNITSAKFKVFTESLNIFIVNFQAVLQGAKHNQCR